MLMMSSISLIPDYVKYGGSSSKTVVFLVPTTKIIHIDA